MMTEVKKPEPIAFIDAVWKLRVWASERSMELPHISAANSVDEGERWLLYDSDDQLIARVGYDDNGRLSVL